MSISVVVSELELKLALILIRIYVQTIPLFNQPFCFFLTNSPLPKSIPFTIPED